MACISPLNLSMTSTRASGGLESNSSFTATSSESEEEEQGCCCSPLGRGFVDGGVEEDGTEFSTVI